MASSRLTVLPQPSCHTLGTRKPGRHFSHWEAHPHFTDRKLRLSGDKILGPAGCEGTGRLWAFPAAPRSFSSGVLRLGISTGLPDPGRPRGSGSGVRGPDAPAMTSSPVSRVVYNGKRNSSPRSPPSSSEIFTPAHEENVRFIYEAWQGVERDLRSQMSGSERGLVEEYVEKVPNPSLKTFKPIDLSDLKRRNTQDAKKS
ncbi:mapk-regulated corepressor-interacting protein 1 isoform X1 [Bos javanicus]|uniref:mapk-regulated corepressor-interacting protein 1 isoform X1 n=1 Tax=Bos javanicus TaxID=9906 RepID=UPI002AA7C3D9|nr:mapk-regulated corepressor-interacting protein 1 isoform X1 [Bos javanicus]